VQYPGDVEVGDLNIVQFEHFFKPFKLYHKFFERSEESVTPYPWGRRILHFTH
jgi:hypothetical protein